MQIHPSISVVSSFPSLQVTSSHIDILLQWSDPTLLIRQAEVAAGSHDNDNANVNYPYKFPELLTGITSWSAVTALLVLQLQQKYGVWSRKSPAELELICETLHMTVKHATLPETAHSRRYNHLSSSPSVLSDLSPTCETPATKETNMTHGNIS